MRLVVAIGGNALLRRGQVLSAENQLDKIHTAAVQLARVAAAHELVLTHGNGPQVGLLSLRSAAYKDAGSYPLDVLGAETDGMLGYLIEQELSNALGGSRTVATLLTRVEVDATDPAFAHPTKPIGPVYTQSEARRIAAARHWTIAADGSGFRRVVASPRPLRVRGLDPVRWLLERGAVVIAAGGGGIPVAKAVEGRSLHGVDAVIDKDLCSGLLARGIEADCLVIVTDVKAVFLGWGTPQQRGEQGHAAGACETLVRCRVDGAESRSRLRVRSRDRKDRRDRLAGTDRSHARRHCRHAGLPRRRRHGVMHPPSASSRSHGNKSFRSRCVYVVHRTEACA